VSNHSRIGASAFFLGLFLASVVAQPLLEPSYDPLRQGISEFVHTGSEVVALVGFLAWACSLALLALLVTGASGQSGDTRHARLEAALLVGAALGLLVVACFATDRGVESAGVITQTTATGRVHDIASGLITLALAAAVLLDGIRTRAIGLTCSIFAAAVGSSAVLFILGDPLPGLRQRCLVACACLWQAVALRRLWSGEPPTSGRSSADSRCSTS
jgi:hypothetical protein